MTESSWSRIDVRQLPQKIHAEPGSLHVWSIPLDLASRVIEFWAGFLSEEERRRAGRFVRAQDRRRYAIAHAALRLVLMRYTGVDMADLRFVAGPQGKPALANADAPAIAFNLTHSGELAMIAVSSPARLGVDVEELRPVDDAGAIAKSFFAATECAALEALAPAERSAAFLICWTRKEAFVKALGGGLSIELSGFEVSLSRTNPAFLRIADPALAAQSWTMIHLEPATDYVGAVITDAVPLETRFLHLDLAAL